MLTSATPMLGIACWIINHLAVLVDSFQLPMPRRKELCLTLRPTRNTHCLPPTTYLSSKTIKNITAQQPPPAIAHHILPCTEWQSWHFASVPCEMLWKDVKIQYPKISQDCPCLSTSGCAKESAAQALATSQAKLLALSGARFYISLWDMEVSWNRSTSKSSIF